MLRNTSMMGSPARQCVMDRPGSRPMAGSVVGRLLAVLAGLEAGQHRVGALGFGQDAGLAQALVKAVAVAVAGYFAGRFQPCAALGLLLLDALQRVQCGLQARVGALIALGNCGLCTLHALGRLDWISLLLEAADMAFCLVDGVAQLAGAVAQLVGQLLFFAQ